MSDRWQEFCESLGGLTRQERHQKLEEYIRNNQPVGSSHREIRERQSGAQFVPVTNESLGWDAAVSMLSLQLLGCAEPILRRLLSHYALADGKASQLSWLTGVWIGGRRVIVLTVNGRAVLFAYVEGGLERQSVGRNPSGACLSVRFIEFGE